MPWPSMPWPSMPWPSMPWYRACAISTRLGPLRALMSATGSGLRRVRLMLAMASSGVASPSDLPVSSSTPTTRAACGSKKTVKRQRTILGVVMREVQRKLDAQTELLAAGGTPCNEPSDPKAFSDLQMWLERAERIRTQQRHDKNKLYALHAPEVECIGKGKARKPYEFGVKVSLAVTHKSGLMVGARSFPGNPYDGHVLAVQLEQTTNLLQDLGRSPTQVIVDLGFRGVDADNPGIEIIHRGRYKSLTLQQKRWLKRRQAIEPMIGHTKSDNRMDRCWLQGALGDALHALSCAAGYNIRCLLRAIARLGVAWIFCALNFAERNASIKAFESFWTYRFRQLGSNLFTIRTPALSSLLEPSTI